MDERIQALLLKYFTVAQANRLQGYSPENPDEATAEFMMLNIEAALMNIGFNPDSPRHLTALSQSLETTVNLRGQFPKPHIIIENSETLELLRIYADKGGPKFMYEETPRIENKEDE